jgi:hypothetical protein
MPKGMKTNEEFFGLLAADVLARLYVIFPQSLDLDPTVVDFAAMDEYECSDRLVHLWCQTIRWLETEGYLRFSAEQSVTRDVVKFVGVTLTRKGLLALKSSPGDGNQSSPYGDQLISSMKQIHDDTTKSVLAEIVNRVLLVSI